MFCYLQSKYTVRYWPNVVRNKVEKIFTYICTYMISRKCEKIHIVFSRPLFLQTKRKYWKSPKSTEVNEKIILYLIKSFLFHFVSGKPLARIQFFFLWHLERETLFRVESVINCRILTSNVDLLNCHPYLFETLHLHEKKQPNLYTHHFIRSLWVYI